MKAGDIEVDGDLITQTLEVYTNSVHKLSLERISYETKSAYEIRLNDIYIRGNEDYEEIIKIYDAYVKYFKSLIL